MSRMRAPAPALVIACLSLLISLGGVGYAAVTLPKNSVGTEQLRKGAVTNEKVKRHSLTASVFKAGVLRQGPATAYFADVSPAGTIVDSSAGVTVRPNSEGRFIVTFPRAVVHCGASATIGFNRTFGPRPVSGGMIQADLSNAFPNNVYVQTFFENGTPVSSAFHVIVFC